MSLKNLQSIGLRVWYDRFELRLGDSLRRCLDEGLNTCQYGIVILSKAFFAKHYPNAELDGLAQREVDGRKVILPVWHGGGAQEVRAYSPVLADRIAVRTQDGIEAVAWKILEVVFPEVSVQLRAAASKVQSLPEIKSGRDLVSVIRGSLAFNFANDEPRDADDAECIASFFQHLQDWGDIESDLDVGERVRGEFAIQEAVDDICSRGWQIFGAQRKQKVSFGSHSDAWPVAVLVLVREGTQAVIELSEGGFGILKRPDDNS